MWRPLGWIAYLCINANARLRQICSRMCGSLLRTGTGTGSVNPPMASLFVLGSTAPQSHREDKPKDVASSHAAFCQRWHTIFHQQQQHAPQSHTARVTHIQHGPATHVSPDTMTAHKACNEHVPHGRNMVWHTCLKHAPQSHTARVTHIQHGPATHVSPDTMAAHKSCNERVPHGRNGTPESPSRDPKHGQND